MVNILNIIKEYFCLFFSSIYVLRRDFIFFVWSPKSRFMAAQSVKKTEKCNTYTRKKGSIFQDKKNVLQILTVDVRNRHMLILRSRVIFCQIAIGMVNLSHYTWLGWTDFDGEDQNCPNLYDGSSVGNEPGFL